MPMTCDQDRALLLQSDERLHKTGTVACLITPSATLPINRCFIPVLPWVPITIMSHLVGGGEAVDFFGGLAQADVLFYMPASRGMLLDETR